VGSPGRSSIETGEGIETDELNVVTGAFGFTGKYITRRLLAEGNRVLTLTGRPRRENPFGDRVSVAPFNFDDPAALAASLRGATVLFNSYWVRFPRGPITYELATENSKALIRASREAGIRRIVHISIANPSKDSPLPYYRGKAIVEEAIIDSGIPHAILRPTVLVSNGPSEGNTRLSDWVAQHADQLGTCYESELARHYR